METFAKAEAWPFKMFCQIASYLSKQLYKMNAPISCQLCNV